MWIYLRNRDGQNWLYTVGFYDPNDDFQTDSDHDTRDEAAERVNYLNGGVMKIVIDNINARIACLEKP